MKQILPLLFLVAIAQAMTIEGNRKDEALKGKCECLGQDLIDGNRYVGNCTREGNNIVSNEDGTVDDEDSYSCLVDSDSPCADKKLVSGTKDQYLSHQACKYFVPPPGNFSKKTQPGCGPEGVDFPWKEFDGNCYMLVEKKANWAEAKKKCKGHLAHLVSITRRDENDFLAEILENKKHEGESFWVGGRRDCEECDDFSWTDGAVWSSRVLGFQDEKKSNEVAASKNCVQAGEQLSSASCEEEKIFFCEY